MPQSDNGLRRLLHVPKQDMATTKQLRALYAGNPAMQQQLAVDDRFHQGKGMAQESQLAAIGALLGSVPYDAAKGAYFYGPRPVRRAMGSLSETLFPGEGFNDKTTSRPSLNQYWGMLSGMFAGR